MIKSPEKYNYKPALSIVVLAWLMMFSCKNDIETINALNTELDLPDETGYNIEVTYTDSGLIQGKIVAPEVNIYQHKDEPYTEFPKGIVVTMYDEAGNPKAFISAKYAIRYDKKRLWEARYQVVAENPSERKKLETEQLFWNENTKQIYSDKFSTITNPNGVFNGENGFEAKQDISWWKLKGSSGTVKVRPDLEN
jgi:LPS export ABC transporter protein LptC